MIHRVDSPESTEGQRRDEGSREPLADLLSDPHCRYLLHYLRNHEGPVSVSEVSRHVVAEITDGSPDEVPGDVQRRVQTWFHHGQLPTLDDYGVVEFDPESGTVSLTDEPDR
jgi:predicted transcriptional regulator